MIYPDVFAGGVCVCVRVHRFMLLGFLQASYICALVSDINLG